MITCCFCAAAAETPLVARTAATAPAPAAATAAVRQPVRLLMCFPLDSRAQAGAAARPDVHRSETPASDPRPRYHVPGRAPGTAARTAGARQRVAATRACGRSVSRRAVTT